MARHRPDVDMAFDPTDPYDPYPERRRRVPRWPFAAAGVVVLLAAGLLAWRATGHEPTSSAGSAADGGTCTEGYVSIRVAVAPTAAGPVRTAAAKYMAQHPVASDHCVQVDVFTADPQSVFSGLTQGWNAGSFGPPPQAWLPDSSLWTSRLSAADSTLVGDAPQSVATSPVVLAASPQMDQSLSSGRSLAWRDIPGLVADNDGWARFGQPSWGRFVLALPDPTTNTASLLALESVLDPPTPQGQPPVTAELLHSPAVKATTDTLVSAQPNPAPTTTTEALVTLADSSTANEAPFSAVPVLEVDLYRRNGNLDGAEMPQQTLDEIRLSGQTAYADFPFVPLAGNNVTSTQVSAAQSFRAFLLSPAAQALFNQAGLRPANGSSATATPTAAPGMDWGAAAQAPIATDAGAYQQLTQAWTRAQTDG